MRTRHSSHVFAPNPTTGTVGSSDEWPKENAFSFGVLQMREASYGCPGTKAMRIPPRRVSLHPEKEDTDIASRG